jgi:hypothetical protein
MKYVCNRYNNNNIMSFSTFSTFSIDSWPNNESIFNQTTLEFNPVNSLSTSNCWIWLDANDLKQSGSITTWNDKSGKEYHCTQSTAGNRPTVSFTNLLNKRPVLTFSSASSQFLTGSNAFSVGTNSFYLFLVFKFNDNSATFQGVFNKSLYGDKVGRIVAYKDSGGFMLALQDQPEGTFTPATVTLESFSNLDTTFNIYAYVCHRSNPTTHFVQMYKNGTSLFNRSYTTLADNPLPNPYNIMVGAYNSATGNDVPITGSYLNGNIAEIIGYAPSSDMLASNIQRVEGYLAWKWGLQSKLPSNHTYYSSPPPA